MKNFIDSVATASELCRMIGVSALYIKSLILERSILHIQEQLK